MDEALMAEIRERAREQVRAEYSLASLIEDEGGDVRAFMIGNGLDQRALRALAHALIRQADPGEEALIPPALRVVIRAAQNRL